MPLEEAGPFAASRGRGIAVADLARPPKGFSYLPNHEVSWRFPIAFQIVFAIIIFTSILNLPESPRWLVMQGRNEEAVEILVALNEKPADDPFIQNELLAIQDTVREMSKGSFRSLFAMSEYREFHRVCLAYVNQMFQQISGINLITYYVSFPPSPLTLAAALHKLTNCAARPRLCTPALVSEVTTRRNCSLLATVPNICWLPSSPSSSSRRSDVARSCWSE